VLAEKGVPHVSRLVIPGPPSYETYQPWYMLLNPGGTVPTLLIDGDVLDDSRKILEEVDRRFGGPALMPSLPDARVEAERWIERAYAVPERVLAYGSGRLRRVGARMNRGRLERLRRLRRRHPELSAVYDAKISDIERFSADTSDAELVASVRQQTENVLDELESRLKDCPFVAGETYSLADLVWTVTVARQFILDQDPLHHRPALARWYERMKTRPSFREAKVWERIHLGQILRALVTKFPVAAIITVLALMTLAYGLAMSCAIATAP
jgi:glutathione S-transferase